jgi:chromosome segregation ATPase
MDGLKKAKSVKVLVALQNDKELLKEDKMNPSMGPPLLSKKEEKLTERLKELKLDKNTWKNVSKQLDERLCSALQDNRDITQRLEKIQKESIEVIYNISGDNEVLKRRIKELEEALEYYGNPDTYFAIAYFPDSPCGDFIEDFSDDHGCDQYGRPMPGKLARKLLKKD